MQTTQRRVQRVRHELKRRNVEVAAVAPAGAGFRAITFAGEDLADFLSASFDDHVKFMVGDDVRRDYTPRRWDNAARTLTIEFALHGHGPAASWARAAKPGDSAVIGGPRGSMIIPTDYDWHLLAGDASALPAITRRLEELPAGTRAIVIVQAEPEDRRELASAAQVDLRWVRSEQEFVAALRAQALPAGEGYAWAAGEASVMKEVRGVLLQDKQHPKEAMRVAAYWKRGAAAHHENLED
ncbi:siderophore-interacting protein [Ramlibacter sp. G-1-2-2]|uniref:Siderophore-interacting protein n=1 Tax=Ramlibacter agri TaxID=2728837 RepID=A0A848HH71_9BURK|nr:siderophore-interacting protein [Ramlibacter agri]NML47018.1 siderophore-interacting protein [Ramlibacter agri]